MAPMAVGDFARRLLGRRRVSVKAPDDVDMEPEFHELWEQCRGCSMTSTPCAYALFKAAEYITRAGVKGDLVECGVWRGGAAMLLAMAMRRFGDSTRTIHLFDTFAGMTRPGAFDRSAITGRPVVDRWEANRRPDGGNDWGYASIDDVRRNLQRTGYPLDAFQWHPGDIVDTLASVQLSDIALLRLDTDFYESTKAELETLFPKVVPGGLVILDDYGHYLGARKAVDEYFASRGVVPFLHRLDYTGRLIQVGGPPACPKP